MRAKKLIVIVFVRLVDIVEERGKRKEEILDGKEGVTATLKSLDIVS